MPSLAKQPPRRHQIFTPTQTDRHIRPLPRPHCDPEGNAMLEVKSVTRMFGQKAAVDRASFRIEGAAFVGIIGRSEARKSTFLRMMNQLVDASSGEILVDGRNVLALRGREARAWQSQCAMIFQQFNLVPRMDVASNVLHGILNRRSSLRTMFNLWPRADILRALEILDRLTGAIVGGGIGLLLTQAIITQKDWEEVAYYNRVCDRMIDVSRFRPEVAA
jgi:ABC-type sugar transport system ATPase subunit